MKILPANIRSWTGGTTLAIMRVLMGLHFFLLLLYLSPENPVKHQFKRELLAYVDPFFTQAWTLFAPNPINTNLNVLLQFKVYHHGRIDTTRWVDIMQPLIEHRREHFWSPAQRVSKFLTSCVQDLLQNNNLLVEVIGKTDSLKSDSLAAMAFYREAIVQSYGHHALLQYSAHVAHNLRSSGDPAFADRDSVFVRYDIVEAKFPRFSKRHLDYFNSSHYVFTERKSEFHKVIF